jgi:predicted DNA-binding transcriptional regulator YafY
VGLVLYIGASRAARVINRVSPDDAVKLGFNESEAEGIFRVDDGKANLSPPSHAQVYRRMIGVKIANGEWVGVATAVDLPDEWAGMDDKAVNAMLRKIETGIEINGGEEYYSLRPQDKDRFVGTVISTWQFDNAADQKNDAQAKRIIRQWLDTGLLEEFEYRSEKQRKDRKGVRPTGRVGEVK